MPVAFRCFVGVIRWQQLFDDGLVKITVIECFSVCFAGGQREEQAVVLPVASGKTVQQITLVDTAVARNSNMVYFGPIVAQCGQEFRFALFKRRVVNRSQRLECGMVIVPISGVGRCYLLQYRLDRLQRNTCVPVICQFSTDHFPACFDGKISEFDINKSAWSKKSHNLPAVFPGCRC